MIDLEVRVGSRQEQEQPTFHLQPQPLPLFPVLRVLATCDKSNHVKITRKVIVPAEPAEVEIEVQVEKSTQVTFD